METKIEHLLDNLSKYGGKIISTSQADVNDIQNAMASERMFIDDFGSGFIWQPTIDKFPQTEEEIENFDKWFPIPSELPESLKNLDFLFDKNGKIKKPKEDLELDRKLGICRGAKCTIIDCKVCKNEMY